MSAADILKLLPQAFDAEAAAGLESTIQFNCSTPMYAVIKDGTCTVEDGKAESPELALTMEDDDLAALLKGELNGMQAFMNGQLQVEGDLMLAQRLTQLFDTSRVSGN